MKKQCPICDSKEWNYDIVSDTGIYCRDCHRELISFASKHGLTRFNHDYNEFMIVSKSAVKECIWSIRNQRKS
jgi:hypothetical protein